MNNNYTDDPVNDGQEPESIFSCRIESNKIFSDLLNSLFEQNRKDQLCYFEINKESLTLIVTGKSKATQSRASLQQDIFDEFSCDTDSIHFIVNLHTLLGCLNLHGQTSSTITATFYYSSHEAILKLTLEESGVLTVCEIFTIEMDDDDNPGLFTAFQTSNETAQIIVKSQVLGESLQEMMEMTDIQTVKIEIIKPSPNMNNNHNNHHPNNNNHTNRNITSSTSSSSSSSSSFSEYIKFSAANSISTCEIEFPKTSDVFISYRCESTCIWTYPSHILNLGMKALSLATETFIRVNEDGMMCIQHQIPTINNKMTFIDFLMLPCEDSVL